MKLSVNNFAKIKKADIIVDGITVIAGENNTGKSTIGKVIFSIFNSLSDIEDKIINERIRVIENANRTILRSNIDLIEGSKSMAIRNLSRILRRISNGVRQLMNDEIAISLEKIRKIVSESIQLWEFSSFPEELIDEITESTSEILCLPEKTIVEEMITSFFNDVFHSQINSLALGDALKAILKLEIKGKVDEIIFENNECKSYVDEINIIHKAIYIDNPFIIDELSKYNNLSTMNNMLKYLLVDKYRENMFDGIIETVLAKEKLSDIYEKLQNVVNGNIILGKDEEFYLENKDYDKPICFHNLSTGLKSFVILKMLLEKGCLKDKDVLILDEPEIHLHPQWQITYAEMIVLLQKQFDLSVVVTTHSPYFMDAINLFSYKYGIDKKVNYYVSTMENNHVELECVTDNIEAIYKKMSSPIQVLESLRYELNNK
jgi:predicted ATPase